MLEVHLYNRDGTPAGKAHIPAARAFPAWLIMQIGSVVYFYKRRGDSLNHEFDEVGEDDIEPGERMEWATMIPDDRSESCG